MIYDVISLKRETNKMLRTQAEQQQDTWRECQRQSHSLGVGESEQVFVGSQDSELLEALTSSPDRKVISSIIGLQDQREQVIRYQ